MLRQSNDIKNAAKKDNDRRMTFDIRQTDPLKTNTFEIKSPAGRPLQSSSVDATSIPNANKSSIRRQTISYVNEDSMRPSRAMLPPSSSTRRLRNRSNSSVKRVDTECNSDASDNAANHSSPTKTRKIIFDNFKGFIYLLFLSV